MTEDTKHYIVQSMGDNRKWSWEGIFVTLGDAKSRAEQMALAKHGTFFRVVDDDGMDDEDPPVYKLVQY